VLNKEYIQLAYNSALKAGKIVMSYYNKNVNPSLKKDSSPVTVADLESHKSILDDLKQTSYQVISEESEELGEVQSSYWLVDPLDGTKDFLAGNGEFTINIGFIRDQYPVFGLIYAPAIDELVYGGVNIPLKVFRNGTEVQTRSKMKVSSVKLATSRFHDHQLIYEFARVNQITEFVSMGSSLKFSRLALGEVDLYPRVSGSSEWDTAAGQAIVESVGGVVMNWKTLQRLSYGKHNRRNPQLLTLSEPKLLKNLQHIKLDDSLL
jgi:3'(2'), 5'-bisphosphate nucleotidase